MGHLFGQILPLALGAAVSPTVLVFTLLVLSERERPIAKAIAFAIGAGLVVTAIGAAMLAIGQNVADSSPAKESKTSAIVDIVFAVLLLVLAWRAAHHQKSPGDPTKKGGVGAKLAAKMKTAGPGFYFFVGAADMAINVSTLVLYLDALKEIARSHVSVSDQVLAAAFVGFFCLLPILLPLGLSIAMPKRSRSLLAKLNAWVGRNSKRLSVGILTLFGAYLAIKGIRAL